MTEKKQEKKNEKDIYEKPEITKEGELKDITAGDTPGN